jgi:hypothetical protein
MNQLVADSSSAKDSTGPGSIDPMLSMFSHADGEEASQGDEWFNYGATSGPHT